METVEYFKLANQYGQINPKGMPAVTIRVVTNFTDDLLVRLFIGKALSEEVYPKILPTPYRQYHLLLKDKKSALFSEAADVTFIFFDLNVYNANEFSQAGRFDEVIADVQKFAEAQRGIVVFNSFILPYQSAYGNLAHNSRLFVLADAYNAHLKSLSEEIKNFYVFDANRLVHAMGERQARDLRSLYAFDLPFSTEFLKIVAEEWFGYILAIVGKIKKCIVVDLDNILWGGVVGESGVDGIALGPDYPGLAFVNFQRSLFEYYNRGVLLAINSKNNWSDVEEVFQKHPYMLLKPGHFASMKVNWNNKTDNLVEIAKELNISLDSLVFIDDDPVNREFVKQQLPEVLVPDFSLPPEEYVRSIFSLPVFSPFLLTAEDKVKGRMYSEELKRKEVLASSGSLEDYVKSLGISLKVGMNDAVAIPRLSQMSLKTNQFNLTTKRHTEKDIENHMKKGWVFYADVTDKFGHYGITIMAIVVPQDSKTAALDTFLMSCRVMGRGVEDKFFDYIVKELRAKGMQNLRAVFIPTAKNEPAKNFLSSRGFQLIEEKDGQKNYLLDLVANIRKTGKTGKTGKSIKVKKSK